jgi:hypothetical protein
MFSFSEYCGRPVLPPNVRLPTLRDPSSRIDAMRTRPPGRYMYGSVSAELVETAALNSLMKPPMIDDSETWPPPPRLLLSPPLCGTASVPMRPPSVMPHRQSPRTASV